MLHLLRVKNLAIVDDLTVTFGKGLNVITGETGAGKSILMSALGLLLGERADKTMIRSGEDTCCVEAVFELGDAGAVDERLDELGLAPCEDGRLIVRRIIAASGSGKNFVNDSPSTLQVFKSLGDLLVDMHGPHDHQSLLSQRFQIDLLDSFGHLWKQRDGYEEAYRRWLELQAQRRDLDEDDQSVAERIDLLSYQVKEITEADLAGTDEAELRREHATIGNAQRIIELAGSIQQALTEGDGAAFDTLAQVQGALRELSAMHPEAEAWLDEAQSIAVQVQELSNNIISAAQRIEGDPGRLEWLDDRLALIQRLKRKYGSSVAEILAFLDDAQERLETLQSRGERLAAVEAQLAAARKEIQKRGGILTKARRGAAAELAEAVTAEIRDLGFPHGTFHVDLADADPGPTGLDDIDFGFAPNVGEPMRPLRAIASSGEISRVMLATKSILADHDRIPVLVFDEIDANVGGEMGNAIGRKLARVAKTHQVICITHLPQVAVHGTAHFVVTKAVRNNRTHTQVEPVQDDARAEEIARMLGGKDSTSVALRHAREMLKAHGA